MVNQILALGAKIVFSIDGAITRCSISRPLEGTGIGDMAVDTDGIFNLRFYGQRPATSTKPTGNPSLHLLSTNTLTKWNVRARIRDEYGDRVDFVEIPFEMDSAAPKTAIQIRVQESKRCAQALPATPDEP